MIVVIPWLAQASQPSVELTAAGATIMTISVLLVLGLSTFCFWHILCGSKSSGNSGPDNDIDTHDFD